MAGSKRVIQIAEEIKAHIATLLTTGKISDPRLRWVTIQSVKVSPDLQLAHVFYSYYGTDSTAESVAQGFASASKFIRKSVGDHLRLRFTPIIIFEFDETIGRAAKIHAILQDVRKEYSTADEKKEEPPPSTKE